MGVNPNVKECYGLQDCSLLIQSTTPCLGLRGVIYIDRHEHKIEIVSNSFNNLNKIIIS